MILHHGLPERRVIVSSVTLFSEQVPPRCSVSLVTNVATRRQNKSVARKQMIAE